MKTLVLGASPNPERFSYKAVRMLVTYNHEVYPVGIRKGLIGELEILQDHPHIEDIHTVTLYIGPKNQLNYYDYIMDLKPKRLIFNPGTENEELRTLAEEKGIEILYNCTLMMLSKGDY
jgi:predicted CoA-binding protein